MLFGKKNLLAGKSEGEKKILLAKKWLEKFSLAGKKWPKKFSLAGKSRQQNRSWLANAIINLLLAGAEERI